VNRRPSRVVLAAGLNAAVFGAGLAVIADDATAQRCGYYVNAHGYYGPRPCGGWKSSSTPPPRAAVQCRDGTADYADNNSSTCIAHGGIAPPAR
jgi:hypothetical protein